MKFYKKIRNFNTTLYVSLLKDECEMLDINEGDIVEIEIFKFIKEPDKKIVDDIEWSL